MRELLLIRHGQASFRAADYDQLSELGVQQSLALGRWLGEGTPRPDAVAIGPRLRHRDTASHCLAAAGLADEPQVLAGLDEVDHQQLLARVRPDLDGPAALRDELRRSEDPHRAFQHVFVQAIARWTGGIHDDDYSLTWPQFRQQVLGALSQLADTPGDTLWAFTSGGPIAVLVGHVLGFPIERSFELSWPLVNTGLTRLRLGRSGARLMTYNSWPHLERGQARAWITLR